MKQMNGLYISGAHKGHEIRHNTALSSHGAFERPIVDMFDNLQKYAAAHRRQYESKLGEDLVLGEYWKQMANGLCGLLDGETGRLDCGTVNTAIKKLAREHGIDLDV